MKKKIIALALAAVMVVLTLGLASCTGGDNTDPAGEGGTNAAKNGTLTVGFDAEFPPMALKMTMVTMWDLILTLQKRLPSA